MNELEKALAYYDENFEEGFTRALKEFSTEEDKIWLAGPSSYFFSWKGERFAVDLQIRREKDFDKVRDTVLSLGKSISYILITHDHDDHMCIPLMRLLKDSDTKWYLPYDCDRSRVQESGLSEDKIVWLKDGDSWECGNLSFRAFYSPHGNPQRKAPAQLGYEITSDEGKVLIPGDIRDYSYRNYPDFGEVDLCISHLWGGDNSLDEKAYMPLFKEFAAFCNQFNAKKYYLCHLYEIDREENFMWTYTHGEKAKELMDRKNIEMPKLWRGYNIKEE